MSGGGEREREGPARSVYGHALCTGCEWESESPLAAANAARHHQETGHMVRADVTTTLIYGGES